MKRDTAVRHLREMAGGCTDHNARLEMFDSELRLVGVWAFGAILDGWTDDELMSVAIVVNLEPHVAHWLSVPAAAEWLMSFAGWAKRPVSPRWRSHEGPVWNHEIVRPAALWTAEGGVSEDLLADLAAGGSVESYRLPAPDPLELVERMAQERAACVQALGLTTEAYWDRRWGPGKPFKIADPLANAATGLVDLEAAIASR